MSMTNKKRNLMNIASRLKDKTYTLFPISEGVVQKCCSPLFHLLVQNLLQVTRSLTPSRGGCLWTSPYTFYSKFLFS